MTNKIVRLLFLLVMIVCLFFIGVFTSIEAVAYDDFFYEDQYIRNNVSENTDMSIDELMNVTQQIQLFLKGQREDFDIYAVRDDSYGPIFTQREQQHMADVQDIFVTVRYIRNGCLIILGILSLFLYRKDRDLLGKLFRYASLIIIALLALFGIVVAFFFEPMFIAFHHLLFANTMWLLDPAHSVLINMVPEAFFIACGVRIAVYSLLFFIILFLATYLFNKKKGRYANA